ncbi:hypothetical protein N7541_008139 [Penicillium brevicompactum]|uniref:C2H2-type domain-containing protein n=1 Tax=Penicillium brevicompactum TaxID=5074 RepID=A0A9W9UMI7_PENBR|nr:hypothetical protein N7541_008139 [Penicillium brevicompactum]
MDEWICEVCCSTFSRPEHLKRHSLSHENTRPHVCGPCGTTFNRRDSLRRHERTCKLRNATEEFADNEFYHDADEENEPKRRCYSIHTEDITSILASGPMDVSGGPTLPLGSILGQEDLSADHHPQITNVNEGNLTLCETNDGSLSDSFLNPDQFWLQEMPSPLDFSTLDLLFSSQIDSDTIKAEKLEHLAYFTSSRGMSTFADRETFQKNQRLVAEDYKNRQEDTGTTLETDPLSIKALELVESLRDIMTNKQNSDVITIEWSSATQTQCQEFFSPININRFLEYFWALWYPNCPIIHKPLFNPNNASPALLCVMLLVGACLSPTKNDAQRARKWLDSAEELIFRNECFRTTKTPSGATHNKEWLQGIQAGYLICSLQKREGPGATQARIRRYRHASMVTLARQMGMATASHKSLETNCDPQTWWRQFAEEEELIRTVTFVFLIDAALVIFHNSPPRVVVSELKMNVACPEACFQAESAAECQLHLEEWKKTQFWKNGLSIVSVVRQICQNDFEDELAREFSQLGTLNLFTIVQAIHSLMFHLENSLVFEATMAPVHTGLENWRRIWDKRVPEDLDNPLTPGTLWKQVGFLRQAAEFWHLARIKATKIRGSDQDDEGTQLSPRYDHTDMGDVNGLIMEYRRMTLGMT